MHFVEGKPVRIFTVYFADRQVEYIVSLTHYFFLKIKILCSASLQRILQNLRPSKVTICIYTLYFVCILIVMHTQQ